MSSSESDSDDEIDRSWEITEHPLGEDLVQFLECPVCLNVPLPPIRTCYQGHTICISCSNRVARCPLCQKPIGIGRNYFAEEFITKSKMKCKYAADGCDERIEGARLKNHLNRCNFRPVKCHRCNIKVAVGEFERHLLTVHSIGRWEINEDGRRVLLVEQQETGRFRFPHLNREFFSRSFVYKVLFAALAFSFLADQYLFIHPS